MASALASGAGGRRFESSHSDHIRKSLWHLARGFFRFRSDPPRSLQKFPPTTWSVFTHPCPSPHPGAPTRQRSLSRDDSGVGPRVANASPLAFADDFTRAFGLRAAAPASKLRLSFWDAFCHGGGHHLHPSRGGLTSPAIHLHFNRSLPRPFLPLKTTFPACLVPPKHVVAEMRRLS
jgi:hypothetical protein